MAQSIVEILAEILEVPAESISDDTSPDTVDAWDSMNNLKMITAIEQAYDIQFTMLEIGEMMNVGEIKSMLSKKGKL